MRLIFYVLDRTLQSFGSKDAENRNKWRWIAEAALCILNHHHQSRPLRYEWTTKKYNNKKFLKNLNYIPNYVAHELWIDFQSFICMHLNMDAKARNDRIHLGISIQTDRMWKNENIGVIIHVRLANITFKARH